ncbi:hypothetical protein NDA13_002002 [Ustilago tritici]|nr:hypothetical protein NDA13_002002 [Ustilago tritici]
MTTDTQPTLPPSFEFKPQHLTQLQHIALTDEFSHDDQPTSSSSTTAPPSTNTQPEISSGSYDWVELKDAIKYRIKFCLEEEFGREGGMELHSAANLIPLCTEGSGFGEVAMQAASAAVEEESEKGTEAQANGSTSSARVPYVSPADTQNFYPSKRPCSSTTATISPLSPAEVNSALNTLFSMLDDFDLQPPFTIQRLAELVISPTTHYNSAKKWIGAVKRCLSVTATRDAFPIIPVQGPVGMNGVDTAQQAGVEEMSDIEMDRMDGLPPSSSAGSVGGRSRSSSIASTTEPLFSPIPFIVRDENRNLTHPNTAARGDGEEAQQIPNLELGGADRTHATNETPKKVIDVAPIPTSKSPIAANAEEEDKKVQLEDVEMEESKTEETPLEGKSSDVGSVAAAVDATQSSVSSAVDAVAAQDEKVATPPSAPAATGASEPLGVPDGEVDEIDNPTNSVHALTSTATTSTNSTSSASDIASTENASATASGMGEDKEKEEKAQLQEGEEENNVRSSKRRKSDASIGDPCD